MARGESGSLDFFISYTPADERWAAWIAWQLERAGYTTRLQAWDFVPGVPFMDAVDDALRRARLVVGVLSPRYVGANGCKLEYQAARQIDPRMLVTVRIEDVPRDQLGVLVDVFYVDLVGVGAEDDARRALLTGLEHALEGRAKPSREPGYPPNGERPAPEVPPPGPVPPRRRPVRPPAYPPELVDDGGPRRAVSILHVAGPRFGREIDPVGAAELQARIWADVIALQDRGAPPPDLVVVSGDLTESARPSQVAEARRFLVGLRDVLGLEADRLAIVPGSHDVSRAECSAYFNTCEARELEPQPPYYPKLVHYADLFGAVFHGLEGPVFDVAQAWTLFEVPALRVVVAGLNSTMAIDARPDADHGWIGGAQAAWFASRLRQYEADGWLRVGLMRHDPVGGVGDGDPSLLRDAEDFDRLLGHRLNLLVHGLGASRQAIGHLRSDLPAVPPAGSGGHEIIELTAEGLTRWRPDGTPDETEARRWHACGATFTQFAPEPADRDDREPKPAPDPASLLLDRIAEVCRARDEQARVRRVEGLNQLLVTRLEGGIVTQHRIGAVVGAPTRADLDEFLASNPEPASELVYQRSPAEQSLREDARIRGVRLCSFAEFQGLLDLTRYVMDQTARLRADRRYPPGLYVEQRFRELDRTDHGVRADLASELMRLVTDDHGSFVLVLGDFGRGKTFVLHEVARRIAEQLPHMVPILIQLRALDKAHTVEGLVAAHLADHGETRIDLGALRYMLRQGRVVLLFDGFDELVTRATYDRATEHLDTLLHAAEGNAKIILSSRTQHFQSSAQVLMALGERVGLLPQRKILSVEGFTRAQIGTYLRNRYESAEAADRRLELISGIEDLVGLSENPRMLSFIAELDEERLRAVARPDSPVSAAGLYEEILKAWLTHEETRAHGEPGTVAGLSRDALRRAVTVLAQRVWTAGEPVLHVGDLAEVVETLAGVTQVPMSEEQTIHAVGAGSLLVRTEEGAFGFIHDSVAEWLVADEIARRLRSEPPESPPQLSQRVLSQLAVEFLCDLAGVEACDRWTDQVLSSTRSSEVARSNAVRITSRLRTSPTADLRGARLQGEDLSGRNFAKVDFTDANLSDARLVDANLAGAVLRGARLTGARLDRAKLAGADLTNADFRRARLANADLTGAILTGSRWRLAALINVTGLPDAPELQGAAIAPRQELATVFAPAEISVRHGFHQGFGRLPESLSYSRDGGTLAIGSDDGGVLVCETANGRPVRNLQGHRGRVFAVTYSRDDRLLVTGASDGDVRIWDAATGVCLHTLRGHREWAWPVVVSPANDLVASGDATGLLRLWSTETGRQLMAMPHGPEIVYTASFHPGGKLLAAGYHDGAVRVWDTTTGDTVAATQGETGAVFRVAFDPTGETLAIAEAKGALRLWDPHEGVVRQRFVGHAGSVYTLAHHPTRPIMASGDTGGVVRLWDTVSGECRAVLSGHQQAIYWIAFNPSGETLASGDGAGAVRLWDTESGELRHALSGHSGSVWPFAFRRDGAQLAVSDDQFTVRLWDPVKGQELHVLTGHRQKVISVSFRADGSTLATSSSDGAVRLWNPRTGQLEQTLGTDDRLIIFQSAAFDPAGRVLATVSNDGRVSLRNLEAKRDERDINVESPPVWALAFSPKGDMIATAEDDDRVRLWWRQNGRLLQTLADHRERVRSIAFHPTEPLLATGCGDQKVRLWSTESGDLLNTLDGHTDRVYAVSFSADGTLLASASWDGTIRVWSARSGEPGPVLRQHTGRLYTAAFGPAGSLLASAGNDLVIRLWDATTGENLHTLVGHSRPVWSLSFSPDGSMLASAGDDGTARLWSLDGTPSLKLTLLGRRDGWAAVSLDGRYKISGDVSDQFWHAIGMCRFDPGELDGHLPMVRHLPSEAEF